MGIHCLLCNAYGEHDVSEQAAWLWVAEHHCGIETTRPATAP
jgi:hypothetical protein